MFFLPQAAFMYQLQGRYLQNQVQKLKEADFKNNSRCVVMKMNVDSGLCCCFQGIIWPQVVTGAIGNVCNAIVNYIFLFYLEMGVA